MPSIAIVHERVTEYAGSEAVVSELGKTFSHAKIVSPIGRRGVMPPEIDARLSFGAAKHLLIGNKYAHLLPLLPGAMRRLPVADADLVITSHHAFANQAAYATSAPIVSYVHSPARWVWDRSMLRNESGGWLGRRALALFAAGYKPLDKAAASRVDILCANSSAVAQRIEDWWGRKAEVVHPPVRTDYFTPDVTVSREDFFLLAGRLVAYKRPDLAIKAAQSAGVRLVIAGTGRAFENSKAIAGPSVEFVGRVSDDELRSLYRRCSAVLLPGVEDFGIIPVEAQSCGAPVIAIDAGGARDSVRPGVTGMLLPRGSNDHEDILEFTRALRDFSPMNFDSVKIRKWAERFGADVFRSKMRAVASRLIGDLDGVH